MNSENLRKQVNLLFADRKYDKIKELLLSYKEITEKNNALATTCYLCNIGEKERAAGVPELFSKVSNMEELLERYTLLKFYLRRMDFDMWDEQPEYFQQCLLHYQVTSYELLTMLDYCTVHKEKVLRMIGGEYISVKKEDERSETAYSAMYGLDGSDIQSEEVCFIICVNDMLYMEECLYYIRRMIVPEGIRINILTVKDAVSMAAGYNEAMRCSKAKYKVYLHQDTFLIDPCFIQNILDIFKTDSKIGMIGMIGTPQMPESGIMWEAKRYGIIYEQHIYETVLLSGPCAQPLEDVEAVDGLLMITQYDVPWREDLFDGWDFYDCSQSMEFLKRGYRVVVPEMDKPWCVHDCGFLNLENYEEERQKFLSEYKSSGKRRENQNE